MRLLSRHIAVVLSGFLLTATVALASPPPKVSSEQMVPPVAPPPDHPRLVGTIPPQPVVTVTSKSREMLERSSVDALKYETIDRTLREGEPHMKAAVPQQTVQPVAGAMRRFYTSPLSSVFSTNDVSNSTSLYETEPAVITQSRYGDHTTTVYIRFDSNNVPYNYYTSTTDFSSWTTPVAMPDVVVNNTTYNHQGDPALAENPYNSGQGAYRVYSSGLAFTNGSDISQGSSAIAVWHLDWQSNGSGSFSTPTIVDTRNGSPTSPVEVDRPSIAVSWHTSGWDMGYVYVVYGVYVGTSSSEIWFARSADGGSTFGTPVRLATGGGSTSGASIANAQVAVTNDGTVNVFWVDDSANAIKYAQSRDAGSTWPTYGTVASAPSNCSMTTANLGNVVYNSIRAVTGPKALYNWTNNEFEIVWHDLCSETDNSTIPPTNYSAMRIEYAHGLSSFSTPVRVTDTTREDQFFPAIDYNSAGNIVMSYYRRAPGTNYQQYRVYETTFTKTGTRLDTSDHAMDSGATTVSTIGDYLGIWDWTFGTTERATSAWIGSGTSATDVYNTRISY